MNAWSAEEDQALYRVYQYVKGTLNLGIWFIIDLNDLETGSIFLHGRADSDHSGENHSAKSTSGWCSSISGPNTQCLLDWGSKRQTVTAKSTPEAETVALADLVTRTQAPLSTIIEQIWDITIKEVVETDNDAALVAVRAGHSKKMIYLRRHHRVSLGLIHDYVTCEFADIERVPTEFNTADLFTKPLTVERFWQLLVAMCVF